MPMPTKTWDVQLQQPLHRVLTEADFWMFNYTEVDIIQNTLANFF